MKGLLTTVALAFYTYQLSASAIIGRDVKTHAPPDCGNSSDAVTLLRAVRTDQPMHFYSINSTEVEQFIINYHGSSQGDAAHMFTFQEGSTSPMYRINNSEETDNIYTTNSNEIATLIAEGYMNIGVYWYAYTSQICGSVPFYVMDNPTMADHIYTTNIMEWDVLVSDQGYVDEDIAMYVLPFTG